MPSFKRKALFECFDRTDLLDDESQMDSCSQTIGRSLTSSKQIKRREKEADKCKKNTSTNKYAIPQKTGFCLKKNYFYTFKI